MEVTGLAGRWLRSLAGALGGAFSGSGSQTPAEILGGAPNGGPGASARSCCEPPQEAHRKSSIASGALLAFFRAYQIFLSPIFGGACKFYPSCSNYACEAVARHGARKGLVLALKRLGRCRPFTKGGVDLVPDVPDAPDVDEAPGLPRGRKLISMAPLHAASLYGSALDGSTEKEPKQ